ncbi:MAG: hypothetical protein KDH95_10475 [Calditrichaeota bacterium]|nr:hypothetical protein [Calditrichota bacterium]MCB0268579.1 hypothetical protein [Calditrichota bacterium]MCB9070537.1 hypothetical protein [Calditrichia bacterium]
MDAVLENLIKLTGVVPRDFDTLNEVAPQIEVWEPAIVKIFYDTLYSHSATNAIFKSDERPDREATFSNWYRQLIHAKYDPMFWKHQWFVGLIHIKREVRNHMMLGMISRVQTFFLAQCMNEFQGVQALKVYGAFKRITDVIAGLIAEGYFEKYLEAMEKMSGIKTKVVERMVKLEIDTMIKEFRANS